MDKLQLKKDLIDKCLAEQNLVAQKQQEEISLAQSRANEYGSPEDGHDTTISHIMREKQVFEKQLQETKTRINTLSKIPLDSLCNTVTFGAIVDTGDNKWFISTGLGKVTHNNTTYLCVSQTSPIYQIMKGKKKNDTFIFQGKTYTILDLF